MLAVGVGNHGGRVRPSARTAAPGAATVAASSSRRTPAAAVGRDDALLLVRVGGHEVARNGAAGLAGAADVAGRHLLAAQRHGLATA